MDNINGIPVFSFTIDMLKEDFGVSVMSLVENPAVEKNFIALSKAEPIALSLNEDQRIVTGVALRANFPIYRKDLKTGKEYYFEVTPEQIKLMMQKFMLEKRIDSVNIDHDKNNMADNVFLWETFQLSEQRKAGFPEFEDVEPGSWMVSYQVNNDSVWSKVKLGKLNGFSPEMLGYLENQDGTSAELSALLALITIIQ